MKEAHLVYGVYDIIAKIEAESMEKLNETVAAKIRRIPEIRSTAGVSINLRPHESKNSSRPKAGEKSTCDKYGAGRVSNP